jgi:hypothetical protein
MCRTALFVIVQEHFIAHCSCRGDKNRPISRAVCVALGKDLFLHLTPRNQAHDFCPMLLGSLPTTPLPLIPCLFPRVTQTALFRVMLVILFVSPLGSLGYVLQPMGTGGSFCPTAEPMGTDLLSSISFLLPI